jgi:hypothetical protein
MSTLGVVYSNFAFFSSMRLDHKGYRLAFFHFGQLAIFSVRESLRITLATVLTPAERRGYGV